jgi:hypothetical protein
MIQAFGSRTFSVCRLAGVGSLPGQAAHDAVHGREVVDDLKLPDLAHAHGEPRMRARCRRF